MSIIQAFAVLKITNKRCFFPTIVRNWVIFLKFILTYFNDNVVFLIKYAQAAMNLNQKIERIQINKRIFCFMH